MENFTKMILDYLEQADKSATLFINSLHTGWSDSVWMFFSNVKIWYILYAVMVGVLIWRLGLKRGIAAVLAIVLAVVVCDQGGNICKTYFCRLRPNYDPWMVLNGLVSAEGRWDCYGFYSAHAANSFTFALGSYLSLKHDRRCNYGVYGAVILLWAVLVSVSRIFVGRHFLGDVTVGAIVGICISVILVRIAFAIADSIPCRKS